MIVPIYNVEKYLDECIQHIINQTYRELDIILVNDGSTDNSYDIIKKYLSIDKRIRYVEKENGGLSSARNAGLDIAIGDYVAFVDSDDYPETTMYEKLMSLVIKFSVDVAICSYYRNPMELDKRILVKEEKLEKDEVFYEIAINRKTEAHAWSKIYKRELFDDVRYPVGKLYEDIFTTYKIINKVQYVAYTNERLYYYRRS